LAASADSNGTNLFSKNLWASSVLRKIVAELGRVTIAGHPNDDLAPGTLNSILKQAKLQEVK